MLDHFVKVQFIIFTLFYLNNLHIDYYKIVDKIIDCWV